MKSSFIPVLLVPVMSGKLLKAQSIACYPKSLTGPFKNKETKESCSVLSKNDTMLIMKIIIVILVT